MPSRVLSILLAGLLAAGAAFSAKAAPDEPARKPGLWEISVQGEGQGDANPMAVTRQCIDRATDQAMRRMGGQSGDNCKQQAMRREGGKMVMDSVCKMGATTATTRTVITGDFDSRYRMETRSTYAPALDGRTADSAVIEARWVGPCQAGQQPGDVIMANGMKINMLQMMGGRK